MNTTASSTTRLPPSMRRRPSLISSGGNGARTKASALCSTNVRSTSKQCSGHHKKSKGSHPPSRKICLSIRAAKSIPSQGPPRAGSCLRHQTTLSLARSVRRTSGLTMATRSSTTLSYQRCGLPSAGLVPRNQTSRLRCRQGRTKVSVRQGLRAQATRPHSARKLKSTLKRSSVTAVLRAPPFSTRAV